MVEWLHADAREMSCDDVRNYVDVYLDGEFDLAEQGTYDQHLVACDDCRSALDAERLFRDRFKQQIRPLKAPEHLKNSLTTALVTETAEQADGQTTDWAALAWRFAPYAVAAAIIAVLVWPDAPAPTQALSPVTTVETPAPAPGPGLSHFVDGSGHIGPSQQPPILRRLSTDIVLDVKGNEAAVQRFMVSRLPFVPV
ncbi:MAG: anti-sigma factor (TIGR02949 family), partial [Myxococcota bacterium]